MALDFARMGQLPNAPPQYNAVHIREVLRALELYFAQLDSGMPNHADKYTANEFVGKLFTTVAAVMEQAAIGELSAQEINADTLEARFVDALAIKTPILNVDQLVAGPLMASDVFANFLHGDGRYISTPFNMFTSSLDQAPVNTDAATVLTLDDTLETNSISLDLGSRITVADPGIYAFNYVAQLRNTAVSIDFADIWLRKNGANVPGSNSRYAVVGRGTADGSTTGTYNFVLRLEAGDYVELAWHVTRATVSVRARPAVVSSPVAPAIPSAPSVIVVVRMLAAEFPPVVRVAPTSVSGFTSLGIVTVRGSPRRRV